MRPRAAAMSILFSTTNGALPVALPGTAVGLHSNSTGTPTLAAVSASAPTQSMMQLRSVPVSATSMSNTFELVNVPNDAQSTAAAAANTLAATRAAAAAAQWKSPGFAPGGATNVNSFQSYNTVVRNFNAVPSVPPPVVLPGWGMGPVSPLVAAASYGTPSLYGANVIGNPARTAALLAPARGILFGANGSAGAIKHAF